MEMPWQQRCGYSVGVRIVGAVVWGGGGMGAKGGEQANDASRVLIIREPSIKLQGEPTDELGLQPVQARFVVAATRTEAGLERHRHARLLNSALRASPPKFPNERRSGRHPVCS